jgi:hypothetical protein
VSSGSKYFHLPAALVTSWQGLANHRITIYQTIDSEKQATLQKQENMDNHYNYTGASELNNYNRISIQTIKCVTAANCLQKIIEQRQEHTTDQLTSFKNVNIYPHRTDRLLMSVSVRLTQTRTEWETNLLENGHPRIWFYRSRRVGAKHTGSYSEQRPTSCIEEVSAFLYL